MAAAEVPDPATDATGDAAREAPRGAILGIEPHELRRTALLAAYLFVASSIFVMGRSARDALFLAAYGAEAPALLPWMAMAYGTASALVSVAFARLTGAFRRDRFVVGFTALAAAGYLAARGGLALGLAWLPAALYVGSEIVGNLTLVLCWSCANDLHDARSARRLFGVIGVGRTLGVLACGLGTSGIVHEVGTPNLLLVIVGLFGVVVALVRVLARDHGLGARRASAPAGPAGAALASPYVRLVAAMILVSFVAVNVGDFQFKAAARLAYPRPDDVDDLARFMSLFYAALGAVALTVQLLLTPWLLKRYGVLGGALALPVVYFAANVFFLAAPSLGSAVVVKIADNGFQFTLFDATLQLLYFPLAPEDRGRVRSFLEAAVKPLGYALGGALVLALGLAWPSDSLVALSYRSLAVLPIVAAWVALVPRVHGRYVDALRALLARRDVDAQPLPAADPSTAALLRDALADPSPRVVRFALAQLEAADPAAARAALEALLTSPHPAVRAGAAEAAERVGGPEHAAALRARLADPDDACAAAAVHALARIEGDDALDAIAPLARPEGPTPRRAVQDAALGALLAHGGLEGVLVAGRVLEAWLGAAAPEDRRRAAELFARPGIPGLSRVIRRLLADPDASVRRAALAAAGASRDPRAVPAVLGALGDAACARAAVRALGAIGPAAVPGVARALASPATPRDARLALPRALQAVATREAFDALLALVDEEDPWLRQKVLAAASRIRGLRGYEGLAPRRAAALMAHELDEYAHLRARYGAVRERLAMPLLEGFVLERLKKALVRVLRVAELALAHDQVAAARAQVFSPDPARRAGATELCENLLRSGVRERFTALVDDYHALRASPLAQAPEGPVPEAGPFAEALVRAPEPFARVMGLDVVQYRGADVPFELVFALVRDASPAVREMAGLALAVRRPPGWRAALEALARDPDRCVREYASYVVATGRTGMEPGDDMYNTLEKVLFLQRIPLFAEVPAEHLVALARSATVEQRPARAVVFREGDAGDALYLVIEGRVRVTTQGREGATFMAGEVFGEMSVLDSAPRSATVEVVEDATLLRIGQEDFYDVMHATAELAEAVIHVLVRRLRAATVSG